MIPALARTIKMEFVCIRFYRDDFIGLALLVCEVNSQVFRCVAFLCFIESTIASDFAQKIPFYNSKSEMKTLLSHRIESS